MARRSRSVTGWRRSRPAGRRGCSLRAGMQSGRTAIRPPVPLECIRGSPRTISVRPHDDARCSPLEALFVMPIWYRTTESPRSPESGESLIRPSLMVVGPIVVGSCHSSTWVIRLRDEPSVERPSRSPLTGGYQASLAVLPTRACRAMTEIQGFERPFVWPARSSSSVSQPNQRSNGTPVWVVRQRSCFRTGFGSRWGYSGGRLWIDPHLLSKPPPFAANAGPIRAGLLLCV